MTNFISVITVYSYYLYKGFQFFFIFGKQFYIVYVRKMIGL